MQSNAAIPHSSPTLSSGDAAGPVFSRRGRVLLLTAALVYLPTCALLLAGQWIANRWDISMAMFTRDPQTALKGPYWVGAISNMGVLIWCAAAVVCFFSFFILRQRGSRQKDWLPFFFASGLLTSCLLIDDFFMLHDGFVASRGIPEQVLIGAWGMGALAWLAYFRRTILRTDYPVLLLAGVFFALSLAFDQEVLPIRDRYHALAEDGFKLLGIASYGVYLVRTCLTVVRQAVAG